MANHNYNHHIYGWLEKIEANIANYRAQVTTTPEDRIEFITHQYHLVMLINRAIDGSVIFVGARPVEQPVVDTVDQTIPTV